jgi:hypothetical protein
MYMLVKWYWTRYTSRTVRKPCRCLHTCPAGEYRLVNTWISHLWSQNYSLFKVCKWPS